VALLQAPLLGLCTMPSKLCPFCNITNQANHPRIISQNAHSFAIRDGFPVSHFNNANL
jgi:hypothetical protein